MNTQKKYSIKSSSRWFVSVIICTITFLIMLAVSIIIVDPSGYYHDPELWAFEDSEKIFAGIISNSQYNSCIIGSSMAENFKPELFDKQLGWDTVKVAWGGMTGADVNMLTKLIAKTGKARNVIICFDIYSFNIPKDQHRKGLPLYLYDDKVINDAMYWWDFNTWAFTIPRAIVKKIMGKNIQLNTDRLGYWGDNFTYSIETVMNIYKDPKYLPGFKKVGAMERMKDSFTENLDSLIKNNPNISFYIFYPPYSIMSWYDLKKIDALDTVLSFKEYATSKLLESENVKLFDFQDSEIILDLNNYKDTTHYSPKINDFMVECIAFEKNTVNRENYLESIEHLRELVETWNVDNAISKFQ